MTVTATRDALTTLFENRPTEVAVEMVSARPVDSSRLSDAAGSSIWVVFEVDGKHYKATGYYSSYDGYEWDGRVREVTPTTKTITVWE